MLCRETRRWANTLLTHCVILRTHWCLGFIRGMVMCHVLLAAIRLVACSHCGHRAKQTSSLALWLFRRLSGLRTGPCLQKIIIHMPKGSISVLGIERSMPAISEWLLWVRAYVVNTSCFFNNCLQNILCLKGTKEDILMMRQDVWREDLSGMLNIDCWLLNGCALRNDEL